MNQARRPRGTRAGGQYAPMPHHETAVALSAADGAIIERLPYLEPALDHDGAPQAGMWILDRYDRDLDGYTEIGVDAAGAVAVHATAMYHRDLSGRNEIAMSLRSLADQGSPATVAWYEYGQVTVAEGRLFRDDRGEVCFASKGDAKGLLGPFDSPDRTIIDVRAGDSGAATIEAAYQRRVEHGMPQVAEIVSFDDVPTYSLDDGGEPPDEVAAVYLVDYVNPSDPSSKVSGVFCATDATRDEHNEILNGYHWAPPTTGFYPEHGSIYASQLQRAGVRCVDYTPGSLSFRACLRDELGNNRAEAYRRIFGSEKPE